MRLVVAAPLALALASSFVSRARADVPPPNAAGCAGKKAGEACELEGSAGAGTCAASRCSRLDYGNTNEAGAPTTVEYDCLRCQAGGTVADSGAGADAGDATTKVSSCAAGVPGAPVGCGTTLLLGALVVARFARPRRRPRL